MADTIRAQIIAACKAKAEQALTGNGYVLSLGSNVQISEKNVSASNIPALVLWPGAETSSVESRQHQIDMELQVEAFVAHGTTDPATIYEQILGDVIDVMVGKKWSLGFDSGSVEPSIGDTIEGAGSSASALVEAVTVTTGSWAGGDAAGTLTLRHLAGTFTDDENLDISGGSSNVATADGAASATNPESSTCGGLADDIRYDSSEKHPGQEGGEKVTGAVLKFTVTYFTKIGDPFNQ